MEERQVRVRLPRLVELLNILPLKEVLQSQAGNTSHLQGRKGRQAPHLSILSIHQVKQQLTPLFNTHLAPKCWTKGLQQNLKTSPAKE